MLNEQAIKKYERRRFPRKTIQLKMGCHIIKNGVVADTLESQSENLGGGGVALRCPQPLAKGDIMVVTFSIPVKPSPEDSKNPSHRKKKIEVAVRSRVIWCKSSKKEYELGLEFMWIDKHCHNHFLSYLNQNSDFAD